MLKRVSIVNKKIVFFGDFGIDDAVALIYANKTCKLDILGIVAEYGNVSREIVTEKCVFFRKILCYRSKNH